MITYEVAYETAKGLKPTIDHCTEYENAYVFGCKEDDMFEGGNHSPCVIMKNDGKAVTMPYLLVRGAGEEIRSFDLE